MLPEPIAPVGLRDLRLPQDISPAGVPEATSPVWSPIQHESLVSPNGGITPPGTYDPIPVADDHIPLNQVPWRIVPAYKAKQKLSFGTYLFFQNNKTKNSVKIYWACANI